jgi:hypothetical protein
VAYDFRDYDLAAALVDRGISACLRWPATSTTRSYGTVMPLVCYLDRPPDRWSRCRVLSADLNEAALAGRLVAQTTRDLGRRAFVRVAACHTSSCWSR